MKWKTHIAIAEALSHSLQLSPAEAENLESGSVDPDRYPDGVDRNGGIQRMPHHTAPTELVMRYVWLSRRLHLQGDRESASFYLGRALHYIQDMSVNTGRWERSHDRREEKIEELNVPTRAVSKGIRKATSSPGKIERMVEKIKPRRNGRKALKQATMMSAAVTSSVLMTRESERSLMRRKRVSVAALLLGSLGALASGAVFILRENTLFLPILLVFIIMVLGGNALRKSARDSTEWSCY